MASFAAMIKEEIRGLVRKEVKIQTGVIQKEVLQYRREVRQLKRQLRERDKKIDSLFAQGCYDHSERVIDKKVSKTERFRFSPAWLKSQRKRLGLSAADYAKLVGVSPLSVYNWENGKNRPRKTQLAALAALRGIGKREATAKLSSCCEESETECP